MRYRVMWIETVSWEAEVEAPEMRDALRQAYDGELKDAARCTDRFRRGFQIEEAPDAPPSVPGPTHTEQESE